MNRCPLCHGPNDCALALPPEQRPAECWCVSRKFPPELLARADPGSCICASCLELHQKRTRLEAAPEE
jgi:hypothetical protein